MHNLNKYGVRRPRRRTLNPTERIDIGWKMLKAWKNTPVEERPSWQTHKHNFYKKWNASDIFEG